MAEKPEEYGPYPDEFEVPIDLKRFVNNNSATCNMQGIPVSRGLRQGTVYVEKLPESVGSSDADWFDADGWTAKIVFTRKVQEWKPGTLVAYKDCIFARRALEDGIGRWYAVDDASLDGMPLDDHFEFVSCADARMLEHVESGHAVVLRGGPM